MIAFVDDDFKRELFCKNGRRDRDQAGVVIIPVTYPAGYYSTVYAYYPHLATLYMYSSTVPVLSTVHSSFTSSLRLLQPV